ncbi:MAG: hypothetical protein GEU80_00620 [Dehalococcoidia bacterium]|nr:hypothetical protein [Dehalococcoidia bacterium]
MTPHTRHFVFAFVLALLAALVAAGGVARAEPRPEISPPSVMIEGDLAPGSSVGLPPVTVTNTGDEAGSFRVRVGNIGEQSEHAPEGEWFGGTVGPFELAPGASRTVTLLLQLPAEAQGGDYSAMVLAERLNGDQPDTAAATWLAFHVDVAATPFYEPLLEGTRTAAPYVGGGLLLVVLLAALFLFGRRVRLPHLPSLSMSSRSLRAVSVPSVSLPTVSKPRAGSLAALRPLRVSMRLPAISLPRPRLPAFATRGVGRSRIRVAMPAFARSPKGKRITPGLGAARPVRGGTNLVAALALTGASALAVGFVLAWVVGSPVRGSADDGDDARTVELEQQVEALSAEVLALRTQLGGDVLAAAPPTGTAGGGAVSPTASPSEAPPDDDPTAEPTEDPVGSGTAATTVGATTTPEPTPSTTPTPRPTAVPTVVVTSTPAVEPTPFLGRPPAEPGEPLRDTGTPVVTDGRNFWDCASFISWEEAQWVYESNLPGDPNLIDGDANGIACERLR